MGHSFRRQITGTLRSESGQSIILISVVIMSFMMFFMFALNTGLIINAKISVQAAADAAAYAGAAAQGRQLNAISYLNYDMRRQYKKFVFRNTFVGVMGSPLFPQNSPLAASNPIYLFPKKDSYNGTQSIKDLNVPVICIPLTSSGRANDSCAFINQTSLASRLGPISTNAITKALQDSLLNIQKVQDTVCGGQGQMNLFTLIAWLFRGNISSDKLTTLLTSIQANAIPPPPNTGPADLQNAVTTIKALVEGLGLYPRNIINLMRIETLVGFLNEPHQAEITLDQINSWETAGNSAETKERSILAFKSAMTNLNAEIFDLNQLSLVELQGDQKIQIENVSVDFNAYVQQLKQGPSGANTHCESKIDPFPVMGAPVGVKLVGDAHVNYAVRVKAFIKPRGLLFMPGSDSLELDAIAAAKPFGSRIGPRVISPDTLTQTVTPAEYNGILPNCDGPAKCLVPTYQIGDQKSPYLISYLQELRSKAIDASNAFTFDGIQFAMSLATAPNMQEVGHYNILPPPQGPDKMNYEFIPYNDPSDPGIYRFYAPIFPGTGGDPAGKVDKFLDQVFPTVAVQGNNNIGLNMAEVRATVAAGIKEYLKNNLPSGQQSEHGETETFAAIELPMSLKTGAPIPQSPGGFWLDRPEQVLSSWGPTSVRLAGEYGYKPRFGYSIKFVTPQELGIGADDDDLTKIEH